MNILTKIEQLDIDILKRIPVDKEIDEISEFYTRFGFNDYLYQIKIPQSSSEIIDTLPTISNVDYSYSKSNNLDKYVSKSKIFLTDFFTLHDVLYLKKYKLKKGSPFNIKKILVDDEPLTGYLQKQTIVNNRNQYDNMFLSIELSDKITSFTSLIYTHEIVHTQLESLTGSIKNLFNTEVLPIFIELIYAYSTDMYLYKAILANRISDISKYANAINSSTNFNQDMFESSTFYISIITALKLLNIYIQGSSKIKKEILSNIQKVFDGNKSIEDSLKVYELDWTHEM